MAGAVLAAFLYYRPVTGYLETRDAVAARQAEVRALIRQRQGLERKLALTESGATLVRRARRLGLVKPGERLFIVSGIAEWRNARSGGGAR
jgi:cell division protein FtsB